MKTSNKILLGTLAFIMLLFTAIHVALYAKYKKGEFVTVAQLHEERYDKHVLNNATKVDITGINSLEIIPSDTLRLEIERAGNKKSDIRYEQKGDVLTINGGSTFMNKEGKKELSRSYSSVILYLPSNTTVNLTECSAQLTGGRDTTHSFSHTITANHSELTVGEWKSIENGQSYFGTIALTGNNGRIEFLKGASFKELDLSVTDHIVNDLGFAAEKIVLSADEKSVITLKGANLRKALNK